MTWRKSCRVALLIILAGAAIWAVPRLAARLAAESARLWTPAAAAVPAANDPCASLDTIAHDLAEKFGEARIFAGIAEDGGLLHLFASRAGSWTIAVGPAAGTVCIRAFGAGWNAPERLTVPGRPS